MQLPSFFSILFPNVRYSRSLTWFEKILFSEITALTHVKGYCFATNSYFESAFGVSDRTVQRGLKHLSDEGFISIDVLDQLAGSDVYRKIWLITPPVKNDATPPDKNDGVARVNAFKSINNTSVNIVSPSKFYSFQKVQRPDVDVPWLDEYIKSVKES